MLYPQCLETLQPSSLPDAAELADLLTRYEFEGLLYAHDAIATQNVAILAAGTPSCEDDSSEQFVGEENIKIIKIEKTNEPLVCDMIITFCYSNFELPVIRHPQEEVLNFFGLLLISCSTADLVYSCT
jgi:hypothetical protein